MKKSLLFLLFTQISFSQVEIMSNSWPTDPQGRKFYPDADITFASRVTDSNGHGMAGIPFKAKIKQYAGWGFHTHETEHGTFISRPDPVFLNGETGYTDSNGFANTNVELNGYAGGYTFCHQLTDANFVLTFTERCVNIVTRYSTGITYADGSGAHFLERYTGGLSPYDTPNVVNQPQVNHLDARHRTASSNFPACGPAAFCSDEWATRWTTAENHLRLLAVSSSYKTATAAASVSDLVDVLRISLPDGGVYDNDKAGIAPGTGNFALDWSTRVFEEHARGVEADIAVPDSTTRQDLLFSAITSSGCYVGLYTPDGVPIGNDAQVKSYWRTQGVMHTTCRINQAIRKPIGR